MMLFNELFIEFFMHNLHEKGDIYDIE